jgi:K(+)-stimulated pyrophosphate-energized sodium pump
MELIVSYLPLFGIIALAFVFIKNSWVSKQEEGDEKMARIAKNIADGAMSFLKAEYKILAVFVVAVAVLLYLNGGPVLYHRSHLLCPGRIHRYEGGNQG